MASSKSKKQAQVQITVKATRKRRTKIEMIRDGFAAFGLTPEVTK
jgi:hypothetical protein